jgi:hypothetical protein
VAFIPFNTTAFVIIVVVNEATTTFCILRFDNTKVRILSAEKMLDVEGAAGLRDADKYGAFQCHRVGNA